MRENGAREPCAPAHHRRRSPEPPHLADEPERRADGEPEPHASPAEPEPQRLEPDKRPLREPRQPERESPAAGPAVGGAVPSKPARGGGRTTRGVGQWRACGRGAFALVPRDRAPPPKDLFGAPAPAQRLRARKPAG